jgi:hypothetical protein
MNEKPNAPTTYPVSITWKTITVPTMVLTWLKVLQSDNMEKCSMEERQQLWRLIDECLRKQIGPLCTINYWPSLSQPCANSQKKLEAQKVNLGKHVTKQNLEDQSKLGRSSSGSSTTQAASTGQ